MEHVIQNENPLLENNIPAISKAANNVDPNLHIPPKKFEPIASINDGATITEEHRVDADAVDPVKKKTLLEEFRRDEKEYGLHPPYPADTRR